jgi:hypothetical protein
MSSAMLTHHHESSRFSAATRLVTLVAATGMLVGGTVGVLFIFVLTMASR